MPPAPLEDSRGRGSGPSAQAEVYGQDQLLAQQWALPCITSGQVHSPLLRETAPGLGVREFGGCLFSAALETLWGSSGLPLGGA